MLPRFLQNEENFFILQVLGYPHFMIARDIECPLKKLATKFPVVTLTGPRQSGKTTLARACLPHLAYVSLEDPDTRRFALDDPRGFLGSLSGGAILDEIQRAPELLSYLQTLVDQNSIAGRFILTGSQQFELMRHVSQSLAGRTALLKLLPFTLCESVRARACPPAVKSLEGTLFTGFYPLIHHRGLDPTQALGDYFSTYIERDLRQLAAVHDLQRFERFVRLCAGRIGQVLNLVSLGNDAGVSHATARAWVDLLQTSYVLHLLPPWFTNTSKRLIKSPKLFFFDVGLASWLLGIRSEDQLKRDPLYGSLFENFVVIEAMKDRLNRGESAEMYFYRDSEGNEIDLLLPLGRQVHAIEVKAGQTVTNYYFRGLRSFANTFPEALAGWGVVFGGEAGQARSTWPVYSWKALAQRP